MKNILRITGVLLALAGSAPALAQNAEDEAHAKGVAAVKLVDEGHFEEAVKLFQEARVLDPQKSVYPYELSYAYYQQKQYTKAQELLEPLTKRPDADEHTFELLGNVYDNTGNSGKALATYEAGLHKFPNSGRLHLETGIVYMGKKEYNKALSYYESGIKVDPGFASNYYWAAKLFCSSSEEVWGMIYGELFMNLERNSPRTAEISKLLYDTYKSEIKFQGKDTVAVSFSKNSVLSVDNLKKGKDLKLPFGGLIYEPILMMSIIGETAIDANSLNRIRTNFLTNYYRLPASKKTPNVLFEYQQKIEQLGHLEAYNHWLLMMGDEQVFTEWEKANPGKWSAFVTWFKDNSITLDSTHRFYRAQYD
ncbi:MAG: tetratricopeptide repeat protein [Janthinobacterium lividum]